MRGSIHRLGGGIVAALPFLVAAVHAADVALDKLPDPVRVTLAARFPDVELTGAATEKTTDGKDIFEVSMDDKNHNNIDVMITPEGALTLIEQQVTRKDLPAPIAATLAKKYPKAKYSLVEQIIEVKDKEEKLTSYEVVLLTPKKQMWAVQLDLEGKIMTEEKKDPEAEED